ncbi:MAG TPA: twin-arginine translocation signal domain-containing protein [Roseimicrobium sp.]|nr:twin-arginine translocation signal domain-containing protein [Roseimicrobium sp.]
MNDSNQSNPVNNVTRRDFLKTTSTGILGASILG